MKQKVRTISLGPFGELRVHQRIFRSMCSNRFGVDDATNTSNGTSGNLPFVSVSSRAQESHSDLILHRVDESQLSDF